jgi:hypothetical protein
MASKGSHYTFCGMLVLSIAYESDCRVADACEERWREFWTQRELVPGHEGEANKIPTHVEHQHQPRAEHLVDMMRRWMEI